MSIDGGEFGLIGRLRQLLPPNGPGVELGLGDDAAVLAPPGGRLLASSDAVVEGVHFDLAWISPRQLGRKALAVAASDLAAMGGVPLYALTTLGLREGLGDAFVEELYWGLRERGTEIGLSLVGGDTVSSPGRLFLDVTVLGRVNQPLCRSGAVAGDLVVVSGPLGGSAAGLAWLAAAKERGERRLVPPHGSPAEQAVKLHLDPQPCFALGAAWGERSLVHALIDVSDGLAREVGHLCRESGVGAIIHADRLPVHPAAAALAAELGGDALAWALEGGEDYQLVAAVAPERLLEVQALASSLGAHLTVIGELRPAAVGLTLARGGRLTPLRNGGYDHLRGPR